MVYAVIRMRGLTHVKMDSRRTLILLRLNKKHHCVLIPETKEMLGMIRQVQNLVTWGEINEKTATELFSKRGRITGDQRLTDEYLKDKVGKNVENLVKEILNGSIKMKEVPGLKPVFRLKPPSKGLESRGMKREFSMGGSYGYRGEKINELLMRMI
jgi:large subunit ribosomal protein L30